MKSLVVKSKIINETNKSKNKPGGKRSEKMWKMRKISEIFEVY